MAERARLATAYKEGTSVSYKYGADGLRTQKTVNGTVYNYYYNDGLLVRQTWGNNYIDFLYDESGLAYSFIYNGTQYYYVKNLQGDVVAIVDEFGYLAAEYTYDAWGNVIDITEYFMEEIGAANPIRYRSYYYDTDTGFYYLQSRYYDPIIKRFINADDTSNLAANGDFISYNLYAYCLNNPVNRYDENGNFSISNLAKIGIGVLAIGIGVAVTAATGGAAIPALIAGIKTACVVGAISAGTSVATTAVESIKNGENFDEFVQKAGQSAIDGFCDGFMTGGIMSGASMTYGSLLKNAKGFKIGSTAKPQYGKVNVGYGNPATNGNTLISFQNKAGKTTFRLDADAMNMLHLHYGKTNAAREIHRTGIINLIFGGISGAF